MEREELHGHLQAYGQASSETLEGALLTRWVLLGEFLIPGNDLAFHRMSGQRDGRALVSWEADGLLVTGLLRGRSDLREV